MQARQITASLNFHEVWLNILADSCLAQIRMKKAKNNSATQKFLIKTPETNAGGFLQL